MNLLDLQDATVVLGGVRVLDSLTRKPFAGRPLAATLAALGKATRSLRSFCGSLWSLY